MVLTLQKETNVCMSDKQNGRSF